MSDILLSATGVAKVYGGSSGLLRRSAPAKIAVADVSLEVRRGEALGIVGESGSGKSTVARMLTRLTDPTAGTIRFMGEDISTHRGKELRDFRRRIQMVFQDPYSSLNPRKTIRQIIGGPLRVGGMRRNEVAARVNALLAEVGLDPERYATRYPKDLSGGQRQRVGIARAIAPSPDIVVADEPVSALDVSVRAQILNLFNDLRKQRGLSYVFISHDLAVVRSVCERVAVMLNGRIVETGPTEEVFDRPQHAYTRELVASSLLPEPERYRAERAGLAPASAAVNMETAR